MWHGASGINGSTTVDAAGCVVIRAARHLAPGRVAVALVVGVVVRAEEHQRVLQVAARAQRLHVTLGSSPLGCLAA